MTIRKHSYDTTEFAEKLIAEFGNDDIEVVNDNIDDLPEQEKEVPAPPEAEPVVDEPAKEDKPAEPAAKSTWSDEYSELKTRYDYLQSQVQKLSSPTPEQNQTTVASKPLREITDESEYAQRMEAMERNANVAFSAVKALEFENAKRAISELSQQFPDIAKYIPQDQLMRGIEMRMANGSIGADWKEPLLKVYDVASNGSRFSSQASRIKELEAELQKAKDEIAAKRAQRDATAREVNAAGMVPTAGSVYQETASPNVPFVNEKQRGKRAYDAAAKAFTGALRKTGG